MANKPMQDPEKKPNSPNEPSPMPKQTCLELEEAIKEKYKAYRKAKEAAEALWAEFEDHLETCKRNKGQFIAHIETFTANQYAIIEESNPASDSLKAHSKANSAAEKLYDEWIAAYDDLLNLKDACIKGEVDCPYLNQPGSDRACALAKPKPPRNRPKESSATPGKTRVELEEAVLEKEKTWKKAQETYQALWADYESLTEETRKDILNVSNETLRVELFILRAASEAQSASFEASDEYFAARDDLKAFNDACKEENKDYPS